jgi:tetratricopeptide (TPR) repeat protein
MEQVNHAIFGEASWIAHGDIPPWRPGPGVIGTLLANPSRWFETERCNLVAVVKQGAAADLGEGVWWLADSLIYFVHQRGQVHLPGQADYWQHSHQAALTAAHRAGDRRGEAVLLLGLALLDTFQRRFADAQVALGHARAVFVELDDRQGEALVVFGLGIVQALTGQWEQAYHNVHAALTLFRELAHLSGQATAEYSIGRVYLEQNCLRDASAHLDAAVRLFRQAGHRSGEALALDWVGQVHRRQGCLDQATSCFRQCQLIADSLCDPILGTRALLGLAEIDVTDGCSHQAEAAFQRCLDVSRQVGYRAGEALALDGLGRLSLEQGRAGAAVSYLTQSVGIMQSVGTLQDVPMQSLLANTLRRLGEAQAAMGAEGSTEPPQTHTRS